MAKYLLPCECGESVQIDVSQAGQSLTCKCGQPLEIPSLRGIRELDRVEVDEPGRRRAEWGPVRGAVFASAAVALMSGLGIAAYGYREMGRVQEVTVEQEQQAYEIQIDQSSPEQLFASWQLIRQHGLGPRDNNPYVAARKFRARMKMVLTLGVGVCVVGLLGAISSMLIRGKPEDS